MNKSIFFAVILVSSPGAATFAEDIDHVAMIKGLRDGDSKKGRELYALHCAACHGQDGNLALNPLARRFAKDEFKFGADPYSIWKTTSYGNGLMFRWDAALTAKERYQIVHFIREDIIKPSNPDQYFKPDEAYFLGLPEVATADAKREAENAQKVDAAPGMIDGSEGRQMEYGPFLQHAVAFREVKNKNAEHIPDTTEKALIVDLPGDGVMCYDAARLSVSGIWRGKLAITEKTHHTSYKGSSPVRPGGEVMVENVDQFGWSVGAAGKTPEADELRYRGLYLHGDRVILSYEVGGRAVLESPHETFGRTFRVSPGERAVFCRLPKDVSSSEGLEVVKDADGGRWLEIPASSTSTYGFNFGATQSIDLVPLTRGGPRRWPQTVQTAVAIGENVEGYAADVLTVPLANPYGSWMRTTALDFFSDGRMAVSTLSGDVWTVSWSAENPNALTWSRFAAGLYEPLGLKIVDDKIYVRGRDRITRLHDLNDDGEADFYENFYEEPGEIGASYHAFIYDLQTDRAGNFYFSQSGYKSPLTGAVVRVSPEGKSAEFVGTDLRNPNGLGLGAGGPRDWITVADNPSGRAVWNGFMLAREDVFYGYQKNRTTPMLVVLPAVADSSSGGQSWTDPEKWGPLSGSVIHTSYSRCAAFYCFLQDVGDYPNGFAVKLPFELNSGVMRPRVHPLDGQVYVAAQKGWDTSARRDGVIYRFRATGEESHLLSGAEATTTGLRLTFPCELDAGSVKADAFEAVRIPDKKEGKVEKVELGAARLTDARTIEIEIPGIEAETLANRTNEKGEVTVKPAISLTFDLRAADGVEMKQTVHATINSLP